MKGDTYLTLCLEQAAKSPLQHRHGAIVVRGGKVIGQGFNDRRSGFDTGALADAKLTDRSIGSDTVSTAGSKNKRKLKRRTQSDGPLSMHSEMMAVHSALSTSGVMAPRFSKTSLPRISSGNKNKNRVRSDGIKAYAHAEHVETGLNKAEALTSAREAAIQGNPSSSPTKHQIVSNLPHTDSKISSSGKSKERMKDRRLSGADVYVARLGQKLESVPNCRNILPPSGIISNEKKSPTGSLYEEFLEAQAPTRESIDVSSKAPEMQPTAMDSRPCYRCVLQMNSVGIKRVFWTSAEGTWESAKIRELVEDLENLANGDQAQSTSF